MSDASTAPRCQNPDCLVATTGACSEGHSPVQSCPKYGLVPNAPDEEELEFDSTRVLATDPSADRGSSASVRLPAGEVLNAQEVAQFQLWKEPIFVAIVGDNDSGKTTLIGALYDQFLRGPFAGCSFAGSRSLMSIEKRWYLSRIDSELSASQTEHTSRQADLHYYHLALSRGRGENRRHLLISDRAGETYKEARDRPDIARTLPELASASRVVMLVDGARVADASEQADALQGARQSLRVFLDHGGLGQTSSVSVVVTKADLIAVSDERERIEHHLEVFQASLGRDFSPRLGSLSFAQVAARPQKGGLPAAHGLADLIDDWFSATTPVKVQRLQPPSFQREFDRLLERTDMETEA